MKKQGSGSDSVVLIRGSLITLKRKCGKPTCACADGEPHTTPALSYSVKGKTHILTLRSSDVPMIRQALNNYKMAVAELEKKAISGIRLTTLNIVKAKRKA
jgi:hypothetical protein